MNKQSLKKLSEKRLINMKAVYERAGLKTTNMNATLARAGDLGNSQAEALEEAIIDHIHDVARVAKIDMDKLIHRIGPPAERHFLAEPIMYIVQSDVIQSVFLKSDRFLPRASRHKVTRHVFMSAKEAREVSQKRQSNIEITPRGKEVLRYEAKMDADKQSENH